MKSIHLSLLASALLAAAASPGCGSKDPAATEPTAAAPAPQHCPVVEVTCNDAAPEGTPLLFAADVSGGDDGLEHTFNWMVSAGTISSGQGTSSITVDSTGIGGSTVEATVEVGGYAAECKNSASCSMAVAK